MTSGILWLVGFAALVGAVLGDALRTSSGRLAFLRSWAYYTLGVAGVMLLGLLTGQFARSGLCATVWYSECN